VPFVCGAANVGEALPRISEGAAMIRSKGEASTDNVVEFSTVIPEGALVVKTALLEEEHDFGAFAPLST
jgi:pyridoxal biosynthesis lyase PdxS